MPPSLPYLCLREIFEFTLHDSGSQYRHNFLSNIFSCILVCRTWCETAIPILWRDPFCNHPQVSNATILVDVYLSSFTLKELKSLKLPSNLIEDYQRSRLTYDYARFLCKMNLTQIRTATSFWLESKGRKVSICPIFQSLCNHFVSHAIKIHYVEFEPEYNSFMDFNIFSLPGAKSSLLSLKEFSCYGEACNVSLYKQASKISTKIHNLNVSLDHGCPLNSTTLMDISNYIKSQHQLKKFSINNRIGCFCCIQDLSLALDLTIIFQSLNTQSITLTLLSFLSIDFYNEFPFDLLSQCKNLKELNLTRCWNFGEFHPIDLPCDAFTNLSSLQMILNSIPEEFIRILLIQSGKALKGLELEQKSCSGILTEI